MTESKTCAACGKMFYRECRISNQRWRQQQCCSRLCSAAWRKQNRKMDPVLAAQSRERSKRAMNAHWQIQKQRAEAKRFAVLSRAEELAAIERHLAENGISSCPPQAQEDDPVRTTEYRPQPMAGWRG